MKIAVISHDIRSVHNVGSFFRTADAAGVEKIFLCGITPSPLDRFGAVRADFAKVALGAEEYLAWESVPTTLDAIARLKKEGYIILALEQAAQSVPYYAMPFLNDGGLPASHEKNNIRVAIIVGNEVDGVPPEILRAADHIIEIPMSGKKESLNVAVAFGIAVFGVRYGDGGAFGTGATDATI